MPGFDREMQIAGIIEDGETSSVHGHHRGFLGVEVAWSILGSRSRLGAARTHAYVVLVQAGYLAMTH